MTSGFCAPRICEGGFPKCWRKTRLEVEGVGESHVGRHLPNGQAALAQEKQGRFQAPAREVPERGLACGRAELAVEVPRAAPRHRRQFVHRQFSLHVVVDEVLHADQPWSPHGMIVRHRQAHEGAHQELR